MVSCSSTTRECILYHTVALEPTSRTFLPRSPVHLSSTLTHIYKCRTIKSGIALLAGGLSFMLKQLLSDTQSALANLQDSLSIPTQSHGLQASDVIFCASVLRSYSEVNYFPYFRRPRLHPQAGISPDPDTQRSPLQGAHQGTQQSYHRAL